MVTDAVAPPRVTVIVLNYNGMQFVGRCLDSVLRTSFPNLEVIVMDNCSEDGSLDWVEEHYCDPRLRCVRLSQNLGYAEGNNQASLLAEGEYLMFLNVDTEVHPDWLNQIVMCLEADCQVGVVQSRLREMRDPDVLQSAGAYLDLLGLCRTRGAGTAEQGQFGQVQEVFSATGAAMAVRASAFQKLGGFDSSFFCYFEETDFCWRAWLSGYKVLFAPDSIVYHYGAGTSSASLNSGTQNYLLYTRNRLTSILKLVEWPLLLYWLPANLAMLAVQAVTLAVQGRSLARLVLLSESIRYNIVHLGRTLRERRRFRKARTDSNWTLMRKGLIRRARVGQLLREYSTSL